MTELLSREREFLKLNAELDKIATNTMEKHQQQQQPQDQQRKHQNTPASSTVVVHKNGQEQRFFTYTKGKGPSTLLKKRGAGDCSIDTIVEAPTTSIRQRNGNGTLTAREPQRQHGTTTPSTARHLRSRQDEDASSIMENRYTPSVAGNTATNTQRRNVRSPESSTRCYSRTNNRTTNTNTFTIKYKNPKFVESPSLEVLVKDESATLRQSTTRLSNATNGNVNTSTADTESVTSVAVSEAASSGGTIVRRSQLACGITKKPLSTEGLIKFLKSKITILEEDHERISQEMTQQKELLEKTLERHKKVEQQRDQAYIKHNALTDQLAKAESQLEEANGRLKERIAEQSSQQKELEIVKRELKMLTQTNSNLEKRLYRANEDLENTKNALTLVKNSEREMKEAMRIENEGKDKQIKSLKKQRADLLNAYKKQLFLIDNLKRQNICIEQSKLIGFGEKEFTKVLEWNTKT